MALDKKLEQDFLRYQTELQEIEDQTAQTDLKTSEVSAVMQRLTYLDNWLLDANARLDELVLKNQENEELRARVREVKQNALVLREKFHQIEERVARERAAEYAKYQQSQKRVATTPVSTVPVKKRAPEYSPAPKGASVWERAQALEILSEKEMAAFEKELQAEMYLRKKGQRNRRPPILLRGKKTSVNKKGKTSEWTDTLLWHAGSGKYMSLYDKPLWGDVENAMKLMNPRELRRFLEIVFNADEWQQTDKSWFTERRREGYHFTKGTYGDSLRQKLLPRAQEYEDFIESTPSSKRIGEFKERDLPLWMVGEIGDLSMLPKEERFSPQNIKKAENAIVRQQKQVLQDYREKVANVEKMFGAPALSKKGEPFTNEGRLRTYLEQQIAIAQGAKERKDRTDALSRILRPYQELREELYGRGGVASYFAEPLNEDDYDPLASSGMSVVGEGSALTKVDTDNPEFAAVLSEINSASSRMLQKMKQAGANSQLLAWAEQAMTADEDPTDPEQAMHRIARLYHVATLYEQVLEPRLAQYNSLVPEAKLEMEQFAELFLSPLQLSEYQSSKAFRTYFDTQYEKQDRNPKQFLKHLRGHLAGKPTGYINNEEIDNLDKQLSSIMDFSEEDINIFTEQLLNKKKLEFWDRENYASKIKEGYAVSLLLSSKNDHIPFSYKEEPIFKGMASSLPQVAEDIENVATDARYSILEEVAEGMRRTAGMTATDPNVVLKQYDAAYQLAPLLEAWGNIFAALPAELIGSPEAIWRILSTLSVEGRDEGFGTYLAQAGGGQDIVQKAKEFGKIYRQNYIGTPNIPQRLFLYSKQEGPQAVANEKISGIEASLEAAEQVYNDMLQENEAEQKAREEAARLEQEKQQRLQAMLEEKEKQQRAEEEALKAEEKITENKEEIAEAKKEEQQQTEEFAKEEKQNAPPAPPQGVPTSSGGSPYLKHYDAEGNFLGYSLKEARKRTPRKPVEPISPVEHQVTGNVTEDILREVQGIHDDTNILAKGKGQLNRGRTIDVSSPFASPGSEEARRYYGQQDINEEAAKKEQENIKEAVKLLEQEYHLQKQINELRKKGATEEQLEPLREEVEGPFGIRARREALEQALSPQGKTKYGEKSFGANLSHRVSDIREELTQEEQFRQKEKQDAQAYNALLQERLRYEKKLINYQRQLDVSGDSVHKRALQTAVGYYKGQINDVAGRIANFGSGPNGTLSAAQKQKLDDSYVAALSEALVEGGAKQKGARNFWEKMVQDIGASFRNMFNFSIAARSAHSFVRDIQKVIQITKQLNEVMTNIRIVTGENQETATGLMRTYNALAKELGSTTAEVAASANEWLNLT